MRNKLIFTFIRYNILREIFSPVKYLEKKKVKISIPILLKVEGGKDPKIQ